MYKATQSVKPSCTCCSIHATNRICEANEHGYHLSSLPASPWLPCPPWSGPCRAAAISTSSTWRCSPNPTTEPTMRPRAAEGRSKPLLEVTLWSRWVFILSSRRACEGISLSLCSVRWFCPRVRPMKMALCSSVCWPIVYPPSHKWMHSFITCACYKMSLKSCLQINLES